MRTLIAVISLSTGLPATAWAWAEYEHVVIGARAERGLPDPARAAWTELLQAARDAHASSALCATPEASDPACIRLAELPALAADHACRPSELGARLHEPWMGEVLAEAARAQARVVSALTQHRANPGEATPERLEIRRRLDVNYQSIDGEYLARAQAGTAHFAQTRAWSSAPPNKGDWIALSLTAGGALTATALYANYHVDALWSAHLAARASGNARSTLAARAVFSEAFALHFLEDSFSAGHLVGLHTVDAIRMGTHDYYNRHGLEGETWSGERYIIHGDAFLSTEDETHAAAAALASLTQVADAYAAGAAGAPPIVADIAAGDLDLCQPIQVPATFAALAAVPEVAAVLALTPIPSAAEPGLATFTNEYGLFIPLSVTIELGTAYYPGPDVPRPVLQGSLGVGAGYASDGVMATSYDGLAFFRPTVTFRSEELAIDSFGFGFTARLPFAYVPGDALVWMPAALAGAPWGTRAALTALQGDQVLFGLPAVIHQGAHVRWSFDLGREVSVMWYLESQARDGTAQRTLRYARWDLALGLLTLRLAHGFSDAAANTGNDALLRLGVRVGNAVAAGVRVDDRMTLQTNEIVVGLQLALELSTRFYPGK